MALAGFISKIVQSITRTTFQFNKTLDVLSPSSAMPWTWA